MIFATAGLPPGKRIGFIEINPAKDNSASCPTWTIQANHPTTKTPVGVKYF